MIQECFRTKTGIQFRPDALEALGLVDLGTRHHARENLSQRPLVVGNMRAPKDPSKIDDSATSVEASAFTTREEEERADALSPMHDELDKVKAWWILECLPLRHRQQYKELGTPKHYWSYVSFQTSRSYAERFRQKHFPSQSQFGPSSGALEAQTRRKNHGAPFCQD